MTFLGCYTFEFQWYIRKKFKSDFFISHKQNDYHTFNYIEINQNNHIKVQ